MFLFFWYNKSMQYKCETCEIPFTRKQNKIPRFCSHKCYSQSLKKDKKGREFKCKKCGSNFFSISSYKKYKPKYCSNKCYSETLKKDRACLQCGKWYPWTNDKFCSKTCCGKYRKGKNLTQSHIDSLKGPRLHMRGENAYNYTGTTKARITAMGRYEYREWRRQVFERDDYTCQHCKKRGCYLNADHIKPYAKYPELRYDIDNGRTLCVDCHKKTDTYPKNLCGKSKKKLF